MHGGDPNHDAPPVPSREELEAAAKACSKYMVELREKLRQQIIDEHVTQAATPGIVSVSSGA